jgi:hypothetical protein
MWSQTDDADPGPDDVTDSTQGPGAEVTGLVGVYHADGSWHGELAYLLGRLSSRVHCALCDITHGLLRRRRAFDACAATSGGLRPPPR